MIQPVALDLLPEAVRSLAEAPGADAVLTRLAALVVPAAATWAAADRIDAPDLVTRVSAVGPDGALVPSPQEGPGARRSSAQAVGLLRQLLLSPRALLRLSGPDLRALAGDGDPRVRAQAALAVHLGSDDLLVLGLVARDTVLGVLTVGRSGTWFTEHDVEHLVLVARLAALALDNGRLLSAQRSVSTALQTRLLPPLPVVPGLALAARYLPADRALDVGGDWYDAFPLEGEDLAVVVGDATGHDVDAAVRMAELRNLLRAGTLHGDGTPAVTLSRLDLTLDRLGSDASATCLLARLSRAGSTGGWTLRWSSAGHLPPLLVRGTAATLLETPPDLMLGVDPAAERSDHSHELAPGDRLVLYTDGLVEERGSSLDDGFARLTAVAGMAAGADVEQLADSLVGRLSRQEDDAAVLVLGVLPAG